MSSDKKDVLSAAAVREKTIVRTSMISIGANILLAAFKAAVGIVSHSIAVTTDAVNNLSDAISSIVTIIGAKLAARKPDKKHPLGHGRTEYLSSMIVSAIVIYAGLTAAVESVKKIIRPEKAEYGMVSILIIAVAVGVKMILGTYVKKQGEKVNSGALTASGSDALFDALLSASVLVSVIIYLLWGISLEAYVGAVISIFIIKAGIEMMMETLDDIIGHRSEPELVAKIKEIMNKEPEIRGVYDLTLYNYGPDRYYGSAHMELPDTMTVDEVDRLTRKVQLSVLRGTGVVLTGVGVYSYNTTDEDAARIRNAVQEKVMSHDFALQMHGFYVDKDNKSMRFDVVLSFDVDRDEAMKILYSEVQALYPDYELMIVPDVDVSD